MTIPPPDLLQAAGTGTLTENIVSDFQQAGGNIDAQGTDPKGIKGMTLLCTACRDGNEGAVETLLNLQANVNEASILNCTPLWFATRLKDRKQAYNIVNQLLNAGAKVQVISDAPARPTTPLVNSIRAGQGPDIINLLIDKGALPDTVSGPSNQANKQAIKSYTDSIAYKEYLQKQKGSQTSPIFSSLNRLLGYLIAVVNKFTNNSLEKVFGLKGNPDADPVLDAPNFDPAAFKSEINKQIADAGLDKFFPAESTFLQTVVQKANTFAKRGDSALAAPEILPGLSHLSLYQLIVFCDNSGSMNTNSRITAMQDILARITEIATHLIPDDEGIIIRFLNTNEKEEALYKQYGRIRTPEDARSMLSAADYHGPTELGTVLKEQVLQRYIYDKIDQGKSLDRPLLIWIITDGCPTEDPEDLLDQVIIECKQNLRDKKYDNKVVVFQISQIGDDDMAELFLQRIKTNPKLKDIMHVSIGKIDEECQKINHSEDELEIFLYNVLLTPLLRA